MTMLVFTALLWLGPLQGGSPETSRPAVQTARATPPVYNVTLLLIGRSVDDADPADEQLGWGLEFDARSPRDFFGGEFGVSRTSDEESLSGGGELEATVQEFYAGVRKTWGESGDLNPYLGAGLSYVEAEAELSMGGSEDDSSFGLYGHGGAYWTIGKHFNLGVDLKALVGTDIEFGDADYLQAAVILGYSF